jgi:hypothetical protein
MEPVLSTIYVKVLVGNILLLKKSVNKHTNVLIYQCSSSSSTSGPSALAPEAPQPLRLIVPYINVSQYILKINHTKFSRKILNTSVNLQELSIDG